MSNWFTTKISYLKQAENGSVIKKSEAYMINAMSFTEAEARLQMILESYIPEYDLVSCSKMKMTDAVFHESEEKWYKVRMAYVSYDEDSGKEKKINETFMVAAGDVKEVYERMNERMEGSIVDWEITAITLTNILDIFPYEDGQVIENKEEKEEIEAEA
jgi:hypothetical protein